MTRADHPAGRRDPLSTRPAVDARQLALLAGGSLDVQEACYRLAEGHGAEVHDDVLGWADRHVDRAVELALRPATRSSAARSHHAAAAAPALDADGSTAFLQDALSIVVARHQGLALAAMAVLGALAPWPIRQLPCAPVTPRSEPRPSRRSTPSATGDSARPSRDS